jgi:hypothetical protein
MIMIISLVCFNGSVWFNGSYQFLFLKRHNIQFVLVFFSFFNGTNNNNTIKKELLRFKLVNFNFFKKLVMVRFGSKDK